MKIRAFLYAAGATALLVILILVARKSEAPHRDDSGPSFPVKAPAVKIAAVVNAVSQAGAEMTEPGDSAEVREEVSPLRSRDSALAMSEAEKISDLALRKKTMAGIMAEWLRQDRLAAADWMITKAGVLDYEPLSAMVSDAFFPDDTEMSAMFSFDLKDAGLRDTHVNKLVEYWKTGAHLKFDNSPWEVDGPAVGAKKADGSPSAELDSAR